MSTAEKDALMSGKAITNHTDHALLRGKGKTTSKGFTFGVGGLKEAIDASRHLKGIVVAEWLFIGEADERFFSKTKGSYPTYKDENGIPTDVDHTTYEWFDEYCRDYIRLKYFRMTEFHKVTALNPDYPYNFLIDGHYRNLTPVLYNKAKLYLAITNSIARSNTNFLILRAKAHGTI